jgi:hypothetical protein
MAADECCLGGPWKIADHIFIHSSIISFVLFYIMLYYIVLYFIFYFIVEMKDDKELFDIVAVISAHIL